MNTAQGYRLRVLPYFKFLHTLFLGMELIERDEFISLLETKYRHIADGEGHTIFLNGEAGIGKTTLLKEFRKQIENERNVFIGTCDALFTPRPLAPLYDIAWQMMGTEWMQQDDASKRGELFTRFYQELKCRKEKTVIIFEDIHWADEASFDFIKFLARRITTVQCLFIVTHRNEECPSIQLLRNVMGQLAPDTFTRMPLTPLSKEAVEKLAAEKGYSGEDVYSISGGNPFYVNEILAWYSKGVPANIKDSILSIYNNVDPGIKELWATLSIVPTGLETKYLMQMDESYMQTFENCFSSGILVLEEGAVYFKHELYRRTIEETLSPLKRLALNKKILQLFLTQFEAHNEIERIIHHAKNANEYELVVKYAPVAAKQATSVGAHIEAAKLYLTALEYYQGNDKDLLVQLYESYAYECYLINQNNEAIVYTDKAYKIWRDKRDSLQVSKNLRFLSRLWWREGNRKQAEHYAKEAIAVLESEGLSDVKAMAFSNMAQLKMLEDNVADCMFWGEQAIAMAKELNNEEILSHALNNVGTVQTHLAETRETGKKMLQQSLAIALQNDYEEHAARAYTNLASAGTKYKEYPFALKNLELGIQYCEDRDLNSWKAYMSSWLARVYLETGKWDKAFDIADTLLKNESQPAIIRMSLLVTVARIKMRKNEADVLPYLTEAMTKALDTLEIQRIQPAVTAVLEYEWLYGKQLIESSELNKATEVMEKTNNPLEANEFCFWLSKARNQNIPSNDSFKGYRFENKHAVKNAVSAWQRLGCPYEQGLILFEGTNADKIEALDIMQKLGAVAVVNKMKQQMRNEGIKNIPRGIRKSTQSNPAHLTERELGILQLLHEGMQNKEIADKLFISPKTVDHHISSIFYKLEVNTRSKAAKEAVKLGIIK